MGNSPSTTKPGHPPTGGQESPRPPGQRNANRHPHPVHTQRSPAPPEQTLAQAQGSNARPKSMPPLPYAAAQQPPPLLSSSSSSASPSKPTDIRPRDIRQPSSSAASASASASAVEPPTRPVAVPNSQPNEPTSPLSPDGYYADSVDDVTSASATMQPHSSMQDISYLTRPPRLPLPIEEEIHTPGSPIIAATDIGEPVDNVDALDASSLTRKSSGVSTTTVDEDDAEELLVDKNRPTVPTRLEWKRGGERIYVTGTIFQWSRKQRLHPVEGRPGVFSATIHILPGTHHIRFLVDGQMQTSLDLPTTVDFGNNLVNYIEVNPDDLPGDEAAEETGAEAAPKEEQKEALARSLPSQIDRKGKLLRVKDVVGRDGFKGRIPQYLIDFEMAEETSAYQTALIAIERLPTPPGLPGFLAKPILNAAVLMKDDNSVLNMPNHTVLNHLATSSIKNNTLAVSATTRYKSKYVTTIVYKPTGTDEK